MIKKLKSMLKRMRLAAALARIRYDAKQLPRRFEEDLNKK